MPLFVINTPQMGFNIVSQALAEESSDDGDSGSGDDDERETDDQSDDEQSDDQSDDEQSDEEKCVETEETESDDQPNEETCDNTETDEQSDDQTEQTEQSDDEQSDDQTEQTEQTEQSEQSDDEQSDDQSEDKEAAQNEETSDSVIGSNVPTVLDVILKDDSLLKEVVDDNTTDSGLASALTDIQEQQNQPAVETCANEADDDGDGMIDENCPPLTSTPAETCGNSIDDDGDGTVDEEECAVPPAETCGNSIDDDGDGTIDEEECVVPPAETCGNSIDDDGDGTIDEEECVVPPTEICDNQLDDDVDGKTDNADEEDCSAILPAVVIESAEDEEGEPLSQGDMIAPGEVTFTFSAKTNETSQSHGNLQDYKFECALDGKSFNSCNSPETVKLTDGKYTFVVRLTS